MCVSISRNKLREKIVKSRKSEKNVDYNMKEKICKNIYIYIIYIIYTPLIGNYSFCIRIEV